MKPKRFAAIDLIRIYLIVALLMCHAFAPFNGGWVSLSQHEICTYKWIARISYASLLETFVLISGYLFYSKLLKGVTFTDVFKDKFRRLYIPTILFGILYVLILGIPISFTTFIRVLDGIGNLWFLPMLLIVFLLYWLAYKYISSKTLLTVILGIVAVLPYPTLPFQFNDSLYYLFFFHLGCQIASNNELNIHLQSKKTLFFLTFLYIVVFIISFYIRDTYLNINDNLTLVHKSLLICIKHICRFSYSVIGVFMIYSGFSFISNYIKRDLTSIASLCFGVYLVHEMILRILYYKLNIIEYINIFYTPWVSILITFILSIGIVKSLKHIKFFRNIL